MSQQGTRPPVTLDSTQTIQSPKSSNPPIPSPIANPHPYIYFSKKSCTNVRNAFKLYIMTERRKLVLEFIRAYVRLHGVPPSYEVIAKGIGLSSKSNIHRIVHRLKADGHLTTKPYKFHAIKLVDKSRT